MGIFSRLPQLFKKGKKNQIHTPLVDNPPVSHSSDTSTNPPVTSGSLVGPSEPQAQLPSCHQPQLVDNSPTPVPPPLLTPAGDGPTVQGELKDLDTSQPKVFNEVSTQTDFPSTAEYNISDKKLDVSPTSIQTE